MIHRTKAAYVVFKSGLLAMARFQFTADEGDDTTTKVVARANSGISLVRGDSLDVVAGDKYKLVR